MDKTLMAKMFMDRLKTSHDDIGSSYLHLFSILSANELEGYMEWLYESYTEDKNKPANESYWFYNFHKSIRQGHFFQECTKSTKVSLLSQTEIDELREMVTYFNAEWKRVKVEQRKLNPLIWANDYFKATQTEKYARYTDLKTRNQNTETKFITGHLDMVLWNLIHIDKKEILRITMLRTFKEYDLEMEMLDELLKIENPEKNIE